MENRFWEMCTEIGFSEAVTQKKHWEPWKFFTDKYGEEEAEEMLEDGKLEVTADRGAPKCRGRGGGGRRGEGGAGKCAQECLVEAIAFVMRYVVRQGFVVAVLRSFKGS